MNRADYLAARFLVMRLAPRIGWNSQARWVSVATRAASLDEALARAVHLRARGNAVWVAERNFPATVPAAERPSR